LLRGASDGAALFRLRLKGRWRGVALPLKEDGHSYNRNNLASSDTCTVPYHVAIAGRIHGR
jgi:hypothetical protein